MVIIVGYRVSIHTLIQGHQGAMRDLLLGNAELGALRPSGRKRRCVGSWRGASGMRHIIYDYAQAGVQGPAQQRTSDQVLRQRRIQMVINSSVAETADHIIGTDSC